MNANTPAIPALTDAQMREQWVQSMLNAVSVPVGEPSAKGDWTQATIRRCRDALIAARREGPMSIEHYDMREIGGRARAEAKRVACRNAPLEFDSIHEAFVCGYARGLQAHPAEDPTDEEVGHAYAEWMNHNPIRDLSARRLNCSCGERGFTPCGYEHHRLRAGLSAARATRGEAEE